MCLSVCLPARNYTRHLPYVTTQWDAAGAVSFTWSLFSNSVEDAVGALLPAVQEESRIVPIVLERFYESLVYASMKLNLSIAG